MIAVATPNDIDRSLAELREGAARWIAVPPAEKARLLEQLRERTYEHAARWARAAAEAKGIAATVLAGEEWLAGPWALLYALERYGSTLRAIAANGSPALAPQRIRTRPDGQVVVDVFPNSWYDRLLLSGIRAEVWMQPDVTPANLRDTMAVWYKQTNPHPRVALVLGAGNVASIPPLDVLYKLIADGTVCILKMNPVNEYLGPIFEDVLAPLVDGGYLRFVYGGPEIGKLLCAHPMVDEIHITGSERTHDAIVFGTGPDAAERKQHNDPVLRIPITSELGNVSPTIVVPGPWSDADIRFQAEQIVTQKLHNNGFNCVAAQVIIVPAAWERTAALITQIDAVMRAAPARPAYYPGAKDRMERLGGSARALLRLDAVNPELAFEMEAFAPLIGVVELPGDTPEYLQSAVAFANDRLWGTLGANVVVHPVTMREYASDVDAAVANLRYGCVAVNAWTGVGFLLTDTSWGAYPGHTLHDVRSGIGVVHNALLFDRPQKSVVYAPFAPFPRSLFGYGGALLPKPPWFVTARNADKTSAALVEFQMHQTPLNLAKVALLAMQG
jgi:aldehyde dehydrogenase (NAD(P)+)